MTPPLLPGAQLPRQIGRGLAGQRGIGRARAFPRLAMADGAGLQSARRIALMVEPRACPIMRGAGNAPLRPFQPGIIGRHFRPVCVTEPPGDDCHRIMLPAAARIIVKLPLEIARIAPGKAGRLIAVTFPFQPMTGKACGLRAALPATEGNDLARRYKWRFTRRQIAPGEKKQRDEQSKAHIIGNRSTIEAVP